MKKSFFNRQNCAVTALFRGNTIAEMIAKSRASEAQGADGIAVEIHMLPPEFRTVDNFHALIKSVSLPFMFICYRRCPWFGTDDEARQEFLLRAAEAGAEVIDVMGDLYDPTPGELTLDDDAVARQKKLMSEIRSRGAKVLISSHLHDMPPRSVEEIKYILQTQAERGADICKVVTNGCSREAFLAAIRADVELAESFPKPFIHLTGGSFGKIHRFMGTKLGLGITFGVPYYDETGYDQPLISSFKTVRDTITWDIGDTL